MIFKTIFIRVDNVGDVVIVVVVVTILPAILQYFSFVCFGINPVKEIGLKNSCNISLKNM